MTEWRLNCYDGKAYTLPNPVAWRLDYGLGSPCDSFWVKTLWSVGQEETLAAGTRMQVFHDGALCFVGVVDECEVRWSEEGCVAELSGRGLQALLLDNQAEAADFGQATLGEILRRYVTPFGIRLAKPVSLPAAAGFSVGSGSSCWKVLYDFARYHGGATPRFTRTGQLALHGWEDRTVLSLDGTSPVTEVVWRDKRYGVLSQVTVKDVTGLMRQTVENAAFRREGGRCSRVMLLPRHGVSGQAIPGAVSAGPVGGGAEDRSSDGGPPLCGVAGGSGAAGFAGLESFRSVAGAGEPGDAGRARVRDEADVGKA